MSKESTEIPWERELIEKYMLVMHREAVRDRRWRTMFRVLKTFSVLLVIGGFIYLSLNPQAIQWSAKGAMEPHTAFINIRGNIAPGYLTDADLIVPSIQAAFENPNAEAVVLKINSPGGSPVHAGRIYEAIKTQRDIYPSKKVYAIIDDIGASGGYYIAAAADEIYADRASLVGSIGVISTGFGFTELMQKLGIERRAITAGENKALLDPFSPLTPKVEAFWKEVLAKTHMQFIERVKQGRGEKLDPMQEDIFSGLLWNGEQAKEIGLIDGFGSITSVARDVIGQTNLVDYSPNEDILRKLAHRSQLNVSAILNELNAVQMF